MTGFTLVEILVVIGILSILAAVLAPVLTAAKLSAKKTTSLSNLSQMGRAFLLYAVDADDRVAHGIPLTWDKFRYAVPDDLLVIALTAPVVEPLVRPYGLTPGILQAPNDPGFDEFHPTPSYFEAYGTSYGLRRRATLEAIPLTHYDEPSNEPFAWEIGRYYDRVDDPKMAKVNVLFFDFSTRYVTRVFLFNAMSGQE
ncbi:MAG: prepilin-type N-terminal cleavage/methylation domain-containing protein [Trueperaceae bacterium]